MRAGEKTSFCGSYTAIVKSHRGSHAKEADVFLGKEQEEVARGATWVMWSRLNIDKQFGLWRFRRHSGPQMLMEIASIGGAS